MEEGVPPNVWIALQAFVDDGSVEAGALLREFLRRAASTANITRRSLPPLFFREAVTKFYEGTLSASSLLLVAILNRLFCMQFIPDAVARPVNDERPSDLADLLQFYVDSLGAANLPASVMEQTYLCVSSLLLLQSDVGVVEALLAVFGGAVPETARDTRSLMKLLSGIMSVLSDHRVSIGPVRRSTQRMRIQNNMHLVLTSIVEEDVSAQASIITQGVSFLMEGSVHEPQEIAPLFWAQLPSSTFWRQALERLHQGTANEDIVGAVCAVLRAITVLDASAVSLLLSALEVVLDGRTHAPLLHVCRIITSCLESSVEEVVVRFGTEHVLYQALASGAQTLKRVLEQSEAVVASSLEVGLALCEGLSVLSQVLMLLPVPEMDSTDDPDDYAMFVEEIQRKNAQKEEAFGRLEGFLKSCLASLLVWLRRLTAHDVRSIAAYINQNDNDEMAVWHDELSVALFTTYERLCALLSPSHDKEIRALAAVGCLTVAAWDAELSYIALVPYGDTAVEQQQQQQQQHEHAPLMPVVVSRHRRKWRPEQRECVVSSLMALLRVAVMISGDVAAAAAIGESLRELNAPFLPCIAECLWQGLYLPCGNDKTPRCVLASYLSTILEQGDISLPTGALENSQMDDYSLAELRSCVLRSLQDVLCVMDLLQRMEPEIVQSHRVADRITKWVQNAVATGLLGIELYARALQQWYIVNPLHFYITWRLMRPLESASAAELLADALERFLSCKNESGDMNWSIESDCFSPYVLDTIAQSPYAPRLYHVLYFLISSNTYVGDDSAHFRLRAVVRGGNALLQSQYCSPTLTFELFYAASKEYVKLRHGLSAASSCLRTDDDDDDDDDGDLLRGIAMLGKVVQMDGVRIPANAPAWLHAVRNAVDEFDIQGVLKAI
ncbi:hypothetical protein MOQ_005973 [Trypanosoma cruzi marinkellei]|uniref:Uncharacterized protein n=1 Tax=Trypanosoma cruzi marinkellei TaxID=85056 RepID=K2M5Q7_TRYCR|nr:hypothetical protein MOQ_005973 [Trypanosoma cruzi marinkellei]